MNKLNIISIIPARGGSKGIPKKNIRKFLGKPLLIHSINYSQACGLVDDTYVTTDSSEIASVVMGTKAKIVDRPPDISTDTSSTETAIEHVLDSIDKKPDIVVLLQPTSPFRPKGSLLSALQTFIDGGYDTLLSLSPTHHFFWKMLNNNMVKATYDIANRPRRQDINNNDCSYLENGSLYIFSYKHFRKTKNRLGGKIGHIIFPEEYSIEIDSEFDFKVLENYAKLHRM